MILKKLDSFQPDLIISTADGFKKFLWRYCELRSKPFIIMITEISLFMDLIHPKATHVTHFKEMIDCARRFNLKKQYFSMDLDYNSDFKDKLKYLVNYYFSYLRI